MKCTPEVFAKLGKLRTRFPWAVVNLDGVAVEVFNYRGEAERYARTDRQNLTAVDAEGVLWEELK